VELETEDKWAASQNLPVAQDRGYSWWLAVQGDGQDYFWERSNERLALPGEENEHWIEGFPRDPENELCAFASTVNDGEFYSTACELVVGFRAWCEFVPGSL